MNCYGAYQESTSPTTSKNSAWFDANYFFIDPEGYAIQLHSTLISERKEIESQHSTVFIYLYPIFRVRLETTI